MARDEVAPGEGAFSTCKARRLLLHMIAEYRRQVFI